jgi:CheY-like chemotaxis protein
MHGDQLVAHIRQLAPTQPIIMATAYVEEYRIFGQASARVDALLLKPFSLNELRDAIERVLPQLEAEEKSALPPIAGASPASDSISPPGMQPPG